MPVNVEAARQALSRALFGDTLTLPNGATVVGRFGVASQNARSVSQVDMLREVGTYRFSCGIDTEIAPGTVVRFATRVFRVVWTPPPSAVALARVYGLEEVR